MRSMADQREVGSLVGVTLLSQVGTNTRDVGPERDARIILCYEVPAAGRCSACPAATNYAENADKMLASQDAPATYVFTDASGNSTVSCQRQRLNMLSEMTSYLKSANTPGTALDANTLLAMYANDGHTWDDIEGLDMTRPSN